MGSSDSFATCVGFHRNHSQVHWVLIDLMKRWPTGYRLLMLSSDFGEVLATLAWKEALGCCCADLILMAREVSNRLALEGYHAAKLEQEGRDRAQERENETISGTLSQCCHGVEGRY